MFLCTSDRRPLSSQVTGLHACVKLRGLNRATDGELDWMIEFAKFAKCDYLLCLSFRLRC